MSKEKLEQVMEARVEEVEQDSCAYFKEAQKAIYKELPTVVEKVFHAAFMNCTKGFQMTDECDWRFIKPFVAEMERVFNITVTQQKELLAEIWKCDVSHLKNPVTREENENNAK